MENSRIKKANYNILLMALYELVNFASSLIIPRLIIRTYGSAYNGMVSSITQFLSWITILCIGIAGPTRVALYSSLAKGDKEKTSAIVNAHANYMKKVAYALVGYIVLMAVVYPLVLKEEFSYLGVAVLVFALGLHTFSQYFFGMTYQTLLAADQRSYIYYFVMTISVISNVIISVILIHVGSSIQIVKFASSTVFFVGLFLLSIYTIKKYQINKQIPADNSALSQRKDAMGHSIANIVHDNTDMIVLTVFCGVEVVSVYSVYNLVMKGLKQLLNIFTTGGEAVFGNMLAKNEEDSVRRNLGLFECFIGIFVSVVFSVTGALILPFASLYTHGVHDINYVLPLFAAIIVAAQAVFCLRMPYLTLVQAAGHYKQTKKGAYIEAAINLVSSVILVNFVGIIGTGIGTLLANCFRTVQYATYVSRNLVKRPIKIYVKRIVWLLINISMSLTCSLKITGKFPYNGIANWIISAFVCVIISGLICFISTIIFYKGELFSLLHVFTRMLKRNKKKNI